MNPGDPPPSEGRWQFLVDAFKPARELIGDVMEVGVGDIQATVVLAGACYPIPLHVFENSDSNHQWLKNSKSPAKRNTLFHSEKLRDDLASCKAPIKFCCFHGSHADLETVLQHLLPGGVLCGDGAVPPLKGLQGSSEFWAWRSPVTGDPALPRRHSKNPLNLAKRFNYYRNERKEVLTPLLATGVKPRKVVELGCSSGAFGAMLKQELKVETYIGIELEPDAAGKAREKLDQVHIADISTTTPEQLGIASDVDLLVALDVLEHLYNPWDVLATWVGVLRPGGHFLLSIPNVQNISLLLKLIAGYWEYESEGLLDVTHVRFFTDQSIHQLITGAEMEIIHFNMISIPHLDASRLKDADNVIKIQNLTLTNLSQRQIIEFHAYQYILVARKLGT